MGVNWYNTALFFLFTCFGGYDLATGDINGGIAWFFVAIFNLFIIIIVHQHEIYDKLEDIDKKITNIKIDIDLTEK